MLGRGASPGDPSIPPGLVPGLTGSPNNPRACPPSHPRGTPCSRDGRSSAPSGPALAAAAAAPTGAARRTRLAVVTTEWRDRSHAWHMAERFLAGYPVEGQLAPAADRRRLRLRRSDAEERPEPAAGRRSSASRSTRPIAEALRCGGDKLAVDAVLIIGEHGNYPDNEIGQKQYPRYEFFKQIVEVFRKDGRTAPVFNDKHLSWKWEWAKEMVDTAREHEVPVPGRLVAAGDVADAGDRPAATGPRSRR